MLLASLIAASLPVAAPQDPIEAETKPAMLSAMEQYEAIEADYDATMQAFWKEFQEVPEEEQGAFYQKRPDPEDWASKFLELAEAHPGTEAAASSCLWVAQSSQETERVAVALDTLVANHVDSEQTAQVCSTLLYKYDVGEPYLLDILAKSTKPEVQANACYYLGKHYMGLIEMVGTLSDATPEQREAYVGWLGSEEAVDRIAAKKADELQHEAIECFERICVEFPDVRSRRGKLSEAAERDLYEIRNLQIGLVAPEIAGEDIFGAEFKLSDYRGKVVVLDFWGHW